MMGDRISSTSFVMSFLVISFVSSVRAVAKNTTSAHCLHAVESAQYLTSPGWSCKYQKLNILMSCWLQGQRAFGQGSAKHLQLVCRGVLYQHPRTSEDHCRPCPPPWRSRSRPASCSTPTCRAPPLSCSNRRPSIRHRSRVPAARSTSFAGTGDR